MELTAKEKVDVSLRLHACGLDLSHVTAIPYLRCYRNIIKSDAHIAIVCRRNAERVSSVSIRYYDNFLTFLTSKFCHTYRCHGLKIRGQNLVIARLRLGYRPVWQVAQAEDLFY